MNSFLNSWSPRVLSILRFIAGFLMLWHGSQKLFNFPPMPPEMVGKAPAFIQYGGGGIELIGGILVMIGLFTRPAAFLLSGTMAVAYFMAHASGGFLPLVNKGELAVIYCFVHFYLFFAGGGSWSVDNLIRKNNR